MKVGGACGPQNIARIRVSQLSIMPDGFEEHISPSDLASLLGVLRN